MPERELPWGWFEEGDIRTYREMYSDVPVGGHTCEIGVYEGRSLCSVAGIIIERKLRVHAIDTFGEIFRGEGPPLHAWKFLENVRDFGLLPHLTIHVGTSAEVVTDFRSHMFDLIFIDGDHSYEACKADILNYSPLLKIGGEMAGHDYDWSTVKKAVDEIWGDRVMKCPDVIWSARR